MSDLNLTVENPGKAELRKFGLVFGAIVASVFGLLLPWIFEFAWPLWPWIVIGISWLWSLVHPDSLYWVYLSWMKFGHVAGWVNTRIILGIMFFAVFFPVGLVMRLLGNDPMRRTIDSSATSYRIISIPLEKDHVERPF